MKVAVLAGGRSSEHDVSLRSGEAVARGLEQAGHEAMRVTISREGDWSRDGKAVELTPGAGLLGADAVFPGAARALRRGRQRAGRCSSGCDVPYVGSDVLSSALCMDKLTLKRLFGQAGIPQVDFVAAGEAGWRERCEELGAPLWVKPSRLGSSVGISRVDERRRGARRGGRARPPPRPAGDRRGLRPRAARSSARCSATRRSRPRRPARSSPTAIGTTTRPSTARAAWSWSCRRRSLPSRPPRCASSRVEAFRLGGCSGLARCDFFVEPGGEVLVNEINTMPGFTETSVYAKLWEAAGIAYPDLCDRLVGLAIERHARARSYEF